MELKKYISQLKHALILSAPSDVRYDYSKFLNGVIVKWIFNANIKGQLDENLVPKRGVDIIDEADLAYFGRGVKKPTFIYTPDESNVTPFPKITIKLIGGHYSFGEYKITKLQKDRLTKLYTGTNFVQDCYHLLFVYNELGGLSNNASFPLALFAPNTIELFGSPLNTQYRYCSPFAFEVKKFSSLGSFFNYEFEDNSTYVANPPFDEKLMSAAASRIIEQLNKHSNTTVIVILPVWDSETQIKYGFKDSGMKFAAYTKLRDCKFFRCGRVLDRMVYKFYDYYRGEYIPYSNSHLLILTSARTSDDCSVVISSIMNRWKQNK